MDLKDIKAIIDLMRKNNLSEFELERQDFKIKLKRGGSRHQSGGRRAGLLPGCRRPPPLRLALPAPAAAAAARPGGGGRRRRRWKSSLP